MSRNRTLLSTLLAAIILSAALAETAAAQGPVRTVPPTTPGTPRRSRQEPCWEVAGVSKSAIQERRAIAQRARQQIEAVCSNSTLSIQQKRQEIQQIRQRERQEIDGIISPAQQEAIRSCQESRGAGHHGGHVGGGPCDEMATPHKPSPQPDEDEAPPNETPKPN